MKNTTLRAVRVKKCDFCNELPSGERLELSHKYSYNVGYARNNTCEGTFEARVTAKGKEAKFHVIVTLGGIFSFTPGMEKEAVHLETYNDLFPYVRAFISTITSNAGIPPIIIPFIDISNQSIIRFNMEDLKQQSGDDFINPLNE